jgi:hypothetical protein
LPKNAPFTAEDIDVLNQLVQRSTPLQRSWLSGFLAGLDAAQTLPAAATAPPAAAARPRVPLTLFTEASRATPKDWPSKAKKGLRPSSTSTPKSSTWRTRISPAWPK